jgi:integrase
MLATVKAVLERHQTEQAAERRAAREPWQDSDFDFATTLGSPTHPATLYRTLQSLLAWSDPASLEPKKIHRRNHSPLGFQRLMNVPLEHRVSLETLIRSGKALPHLRPHDLRHTAATLMLRAGMSIDVVSKILGHAKISITTDIYRQVSLEEKRAKMIDLFAGKKVTKKPE